MSKKVVAIHQPNFLPWPMFWHKMLSCTDFVFLMDVVYPDRGYINRTMLGEGWLTVPAQTKGKRGQCIGDVKIAENFRWRRQHLGRIYQRYHAALNFQDVFPKLEAIYAVEWVDHLAQFNSMLLNMVIQWLGVTGVKAHLDWSFPYLGSGADRILGICRCLGADQYASGQSGPVYMDLQKFEDVGIEVLVQNKQVLQAEIPSVLDIMFNMEPKAAREWIGAVGSWEKP